MKIQNHVRKIINEDLNSPTSRSSQSYLFSIYAETTLSTNSIYRVRALFDQAIGNSTFVLVLLIYVLDADGFLVVVSRNHLRSGRCTSNLRLEMVIQLE